MKNLWSFAAVACALSIGACASSQSPAEQSVTYDLVINSGRVMDPESMFDEVRNVGIKDGKIAVITQDTISGKETIDATGHVVAAGFIDTHFHALDRLSIRLAAMDGVTTGMDLELGAYGIDDWYAEKAGKWPLNYGTTVSHEFARAKVLDPDYTLKGPADAVDATEIRGSTGKDGTYGWSATRSSLDQMNAILQIIDEGLRQGALGVGSTLGYMTTGIATYEMYLAQKAAAKYGRLTAVHSRFHGYANLPTAAEIAFDEVFTNAMLMGAPLLYCHDNDVGWWEIEEKLQHARARGLNMWSEYYPYTGASGTLNSEYLQPKIWIDTFGFKYEDTLYDPDQDRFYTREDYDKGMKEDPGRMMVYFLQRRKPWMQYWLRMPHMAVGADSMWMTGTDWDTPIEKYAGHPRTAGTHGKVFRLAREHGVPLMFTLAQMSYWPAKHLGDAGVEAMKIRGRMQEGMVADITIFDPKNVNDQATYKAGEQGKPTVGIPYVIVSGQAVVKDSKFQKVWAGQPIRYATEEKGRFDPADCQEWVDEHVVHTPGVDDTGTAPAAPDTSANK